MRINDFSNILVPTNSVLSLIISVMILCLMVNSVTAQNHNELIVEPLSRNDSALIKDYQIKYNEFLESGKLRDASDELNKIAQIYWDKNITEKAISFFKESLKLNIKLDNRNAIATLSGSLGMLMADLQRYDDALIYFQQALEIRRITKEKVSIISSLINTTVVLNKLERFEESILLMEEALRLAKELNDPNQIKSCYGILAETYEISGDIDQSLYYYNYFKTFNELVAQRKIKRTEIQLENEKLKRENTELKLLKNLDTLRATKNELTSIVKQQEEFIKKNEELIATLSEQELQLKVLKQDARIKELENTKMSNEKKSKEKQIQFISVLALLCFLLFIVVTTLTYFLYKNRGHVKRHANLLKIQNQMVQSNLQEKELMLREIHHRVKNNFEIISSLLQLQSGSIEDQEVIRKLNEGQSRINAMALIHQNLYQTNNISVINFENYANKLSKEIIHLYGYSQKIVTVEGGDLIFDVDTATPLALILNELVTNSCKYALGQSESPFIKLSITEQKSNNYLMEIRDSGSGLPSVSNNTNPTFGLKIVSRLSKQLHGSFVHGRDNVSAYFKVFFKDENGRLMVE